MGDPWGGGGLRGGGGMVGSSPEALIRQNIGRKSLKIGKKSETFFFDWK